MWQIPDMIWYSFNICQHLFLFESTVFLFVNLSLQSCGTTLTACFISSLHCNTWTEYVSNKTAVSHDIKYDIQKQ